MIKRLITLFVFITYLACQQTAYAQTYAAGACTPVTNSQTCLDSTPCKTDSSGKQICLAGVALPAGGLSVTQTCWQYSYNYSCSGVGVDTCSTATWWNAQTCSQTSVSCSSTIPSTGACASYAYTYTCQTSPAKTSQQMVCGSNLFSSSFAAPVNTNNSFAAAAVAMEIARQTQVYSKCAAGSPSDCLNSLIFAGTSESCTKGDFGLKNCCGSMPGAQNNNQVMSSLVNVGIANAGKGVYFLGQQAVDSVSPYVFDAMYSAGGYAAGLAQAAGSVSGVTTASMGGYTSTTGTSFASGGASFGAYGFTYSTSATAAQVGVATGAEGAGSGLMGADMAISGGSAVGEGVLMFNPYVFAAAVAITVITQVVMSMMACSTSEQMLSMHKGASLSVYTGETCSKKIPIIGTCIEYTDTYCSFNSVLAKLVNQQGKAQLSIPFENCSGLSVAQVSSINFSKLNLTEFTNQIVQQAKVGLPSSPAIASAYKPAVSIMSNGTGQSSKAGTAYPAGYKP